MALPITYSLASLGVRWRSTVLAVIGIALVVAVFTALLSMASGIRLALRASGSEANAIVLEKGALSELGSSFSEAAGDWVAEDPRVEHGPDGAALASRELVLVVALPGRSDGQFTNLGIRGVTPAAFKLRSGVRLLEGRRSRTGLFEIIVGRQAQRRIRGLELGSRVSLLRHSFEVVGVFADEGSAFESEIWGDFAAMASAFNRSGTQSSLTVRLRDPRALPDFDRDLRASIQYPLTLTGERKYYDDQAGPLIRFLRGLAVFVGVVTGIGAIFAAMNTMYAIVASRTREVATLRALGFSRSTVLLAFVLEGLILAMAGGCLGCLLSLLMNGVSGSASANLGEISFAFRVTAADLGYGLAFAAAMGVMGALLPASRAARLPVTLALRQA
ncbi:MAG TPA: ABC transporter permease [Steroidobacteraceae bacterium]|nr:ABC transporter permease [Steroidobacteraceae bacterium]